MKTMNEIFEVISLWWHPALWWILNGVTLTIAGWGYFIANLIHMNGYSNTTIEIFTRILRVGEANMKLYSLDLSHDFLMHSSCNISSLYTDVYITKFLNANDELALEML